MTAARDTNQQQSAPRTSVFEFMEKVRMPALWVCVFIMGGFGVLALLGGLFGSSNNVPVKEYGSFEIPGGEKVTLTNYDFSDIAKHLTLQLHRMGRDEVQTGNQVLQIQSTDPVETDWAFVLLRACARAAGITVNDQVVVDGFNQGNPGAPPTTLREYRRRTSEDERAFQRDLRAIQAFRSALERAQPVATTDQVYERFKSTHEMVRASYVFFDTSKSEVPLDPKGKPEDRATLAEWLEKNPRVKSLKKIPEELDADVLYVRFRDMTTADLKKHYDERWAPLVAEHKLEVNDEVLRERYNVFAPAWTVPLEVAVQEYDKAAESRPQSTAVQDRPTPFDFLRERLRIEYFATRLVEKAFEEVTRAEAPLSFEDAMQKYGLKLAEISGLDSVRLSQHVDFGSPRAAMAIFQGLRDTSLKPGSVFQYRGSASLATGAVEEPGGSVAIWRPKAYRPERDATLDDAGAIDVFVEEYQKRRREELAREQAEAFRADVDQRVNEAIATRVAEIKAETEVAIAKRIADAGLSEEIPEHQPQILEIKNEETRVKEQKIDEARAAYEPNMFRVVAEERFLPVHDTGLISKNASRQPTFVAAPEMSTEEKAEQFYRKISRRAALAAVPLHRMSAVESEPTWCAAAVALLVEKREPKPEDLYKLSKTQIDQLKRQVVPAIGTQSYWKYENYKRPEWFKLHVPEFEEHLKSKREAEQAAAERQRLRAERAQKQSRVRADKLAQDALQSRPLFSGEDW